MLNESTLINGTIKDFDAPLSPAEVDVNGKTYIVNPFDPSKAFDFLHRLGLSRVTGQGLAELGKIALDQCVTPAPNCRQLSDPMVFMEWFSQNPADMLPLEAAAINALARPWEGGEADGEEETPTDDANGQA